jgi:predicted dinucleotide-binding enzyme
LLAVHWSRVDDVLKQAGDLDGTVVITCSLPMNADDTGLIVAHTSSGAEELARKAPKAQVVSAFGTVPSEVLFSVFDRRRRKNRPSLLYSGDDSKAKRVAAKLIGDAGFEPVDAGALRIARYTEPFTLAVAQLAYEGDRGPALSYRFEWFEERGP